MKKLLTFVFAALLSLSFAGASLASEQTMTTRDTATSKPSVMKERLVKEVATVTAIDMTTRIVTMKDSKGKIFDIKAGQDVVNLPQVKVGDKVHVDYYQSVAIDVMAPGTAPQGTEGSTVIDRAAPGGKPGGMISDQLTVTGKVDSIDKKNQIVTLKGPQGKTLEIKVEDPRNMENVNVGDDVVLTVTEATAVSVVPAPDKKDEKAKKK